MPVKFWRLVQHYRHLSLTQEWKLMLTSVQELRQLVYPAMQLLLGAVRLVPSPTYYPLHLRLLQVGQPSSCRPLHG